MSIIDNNLNIVHKLSSFTPRVFSGVQPTGSLHLGNYLGAIKRFIPLQKEYECIYCVVDLHAITVDQKPEELTKATREVTAAFIAAGVDAKNHIIFPQSQVSVHAELAWILNCVARVGWLNRMTQFKEKAGKNRENASLGLYSYPVLMAADILSYRATHVPVGEDQKQHLELTRDIAQKFNTDFGDRIKEFGLDNGIYLPLPEPIIAGPAPRVMSLRDGSSKMSKSDPSDYSRINLTDDADEISQKVKKARTDSDTLPSDIEGLKGRAEIENLVTIFAALAEYDADAVLKQFGGGQFSSFKNALADLAVAKLSPMGDEIRRLVSSPDHIDNILRDGAERAYKIAKPVLKDIHKIVGFLQLGR